MSRFHAEMFTFLVERHSCTVVGTSVPFYVSLERSHFNTGCGLSTVLSRR